MKKLLCGLIVTFLIASFANAADAPGHSFEVLKKYFLSLSIGTDLRKIENELNLPPPDKTYMGSSLYEDRRFRYYNHQGMMLQIGLVQHSEDSSHEQGEFSYNGDFLIISSEREYDHCCSENNWTGIYDGPLRR